MRDRMFAEMTPEWKDAYEAGIFTEFMEQRAPGHTVLGDMIYRKGLLDLKAEVDAALARLDFFNDPQAYDKEQELQGHVALPPTRSSASPNATRRWRENWPRPRADPQRKAELRKIAEVCRHVPAHAPRDFQEALQAYWFTHLARDHRAEHLGLVQPRPSRPAPVSRSTSAAWRTARSRASRPENCSSVSG